MRLEGLQYRFDIYLRFVLKMHLFRTPHSWLYWGGGRSARLVRSFQKSLDQTIIGPTKILKISDFDCKWQNFWSNQGRSGPTASAVPTVLHILPRTAHNFFRVDHVLQNYIQHVYVLESDTFLNF